MAIERFVVLDSDMNQCGSTFSTEKAAIAHAKEEAGENTNDWGDDATYFVAELVGEVSARRDPPPVTYKNLRSKKR